MKYASLLHLHTLRLRRKISVPYSALSDSLALLTRLQRAASLARRASRFTILARRLELQMIAVEGGSAEDAASTQGDAKAIKKAQVDKRDRAMAEAALTLAEIRTSTIRFRWVLPLPSMVCPKH